MIYIDSYNPSSKNPSTMVYNKLQFCTYECWGMTLYINDDFLSQVSSWVTMLLWSLFFFFTLLRPLLCIYSLTEHSASLTIHTCIQAYIPQCVKKGQRWNPVFVLPKGKAVLQSPSTLGILITCQTGPGSCISSHATEPTLDGELWQPTDLLLLNLDSLVVWNDMEWLGYCLHSQYSLPITMKTSMVFQGSILRSALQMRNEDPFGFENKVAKICWLVGLFWTNKNAWLELLSRVRTIYICHLWSFGNSRIAGFESI